MTSQEKAAPPVSGGHTVEIQDSDARVRVEVGGATVADSTRARVLLESHYPPRWYLPPADVDAAVLRPSAQATHCPFKGDASYHSVEVAGELYPDLVWYYPEPIPSAAAIAGLLSFDPARARIFVDDEPA